jgi:tetratricopeptide (TPR) repeat protein
VLAALVFLTVACSQAAAAQDDLQQARKLRAQGKLELALAFYESVIEKNKNSFEGNLGAGEVLDLNGDYRKARKYLTKAIAVAPVQSKAQALNAIAVSYAFSRDCRSASKYERQLYDLRMASQDRAGAAEVASQAGLVCQESGSQEEADQWFKLGPSGEKVEKDDAYALSVQAQSLEKSGKKNEAIALYRKILTINSHDVSTALARPLARKKLERE